MVRKIKTDRQKLLMRINVRAVFAAAGLVCIGIGVGVVWHWGAGLAIGGLGLWADMNFGK